MTKIDVSSLNDEELNELWDAVIVRNRDLVNAKITSFTKNKKVVSELKKVCKDFKKERNNFDKRRYSINDYVNKLAKEYDISEYDVFIIGGIEEGYI